MKDVDRHVAQVIEAIDALPDVADGESVQGLLFALDRLDARIGDAVRRLDQEGATVEDGAVNVAQWLRAKCGRSDRQAKEIARRASRLAGCSALSAAWREGRISTAQVDLLVAAVSDRTAPLLREHDAALATALTGLSARHSALAVRHWRAHAEALVEGPAPTTPQRSLYLSRAFDGGGELSGCLDHGGYEVVDAALSAATTPDGDGEPARTMAQRRGDALVAIARFYLDHANDRSQGRRRPHVQVTITLEELERRTGGRSLDGHFVDAATMRALLCDAGIHRVVTDAGSVVLDVGRTTRTVNHHLFSALAARDGGCRFPGCDRPVSWCEAHHVVPWAEGGRTAPSNTVLLCWRHHHDFAHQPGWNLELLPDATVEVTTPAGRTLTSRPPPALVYAA